MKLEEEYRREWNELKLKYLAKFQPLYVSRRKELRAEAVQGPGTTNLPQFWVKAMKNHLLLSEMIEEHDVPILVRSCFYLILSYFIILPVFILLVCFYLISCFILLIISLCFIIVSSGRYRFPVDRPSRANSMTVT